MQIHLQQKLKKLVQRASPMKLTRLYPHITPEQKDLIRNAEYGGLLDIKCSKLHPGLCQYLMDSFDSSTCQLVFPGRGSVPITEESAHQVIGVPMGCLDVVYARDTNVIHFMKEQLAIQAESNRLLLHWNRNLWQ
jgi:hypothetical protein